jgi:transposase-like protein
MPETTKVCPKCYHLKLRLVRSTYLSNGKVSNKWRCGHCGYEETIEKLDEVVR